MKLVIFGLSISSTWGNGHAALWRGLVAALARRGHEVVFFERDVPYYAAHRDLAVLDTGRLELYADWDDARTRARAHLSDADVAMVTSYCPDASAATALLLDSPVGVRCFYDLDSPLTLARLQAGDRPDYIGPRGLADFDLVLSYAGGATIDALRDQLGARRVAPLYGSVDPAVHMAHGGPGPSDGGLSYLGTYARDRQDALVRLLVEPARRLPGERFMIAGAQYPDDFPWMPNIFFVRHLPPAQHAAFYASARLTLNITRAPMVAAGYCPSGRLFEAAACGAPILTDRWPGLDDFFEPGREILVADTSDEALDALRQPPAALARIAAHARERVLAQHTADHRAGELEVALGQTET
jgi:spore maturation protein CgeB